MIHLSAPLYDPLGHVGIDNLPASELGDVTRRVNRSKTLDGGVAINDGGYSAGDRTFRVRWKIRSADQFQQVQRMVQLYSLLTVITTEGVFTAAPESLTDRGGIGTLTLLVKDQAA